MKFKCTVNGSCLGVLLIFLLFLTACGTDNSNASTSTSSNAESEVIEIDFNNISPPNGDTAKNVLEPWAKLVEEKTNGKVKVNLYHSGALGATTKVLQDVEGGVYDAGIMLPTYFRESDVFPITITELPFALSFTGIKESTEVMVEFSDKYAEETWKKVIPIGMTRADDSFIYSTKPIKTYEDVKKVKFGSPGPIEAGLSKDWGADPISISREEMYTGLQKGMIEAYSYSASGGPALHLHEVAPYATKLPFKGVAAYAIMNKSFYEELPDDIKKIFDEELIPTFTTMWIDSYQKAQDAGIKKLEEAGVEIISLPSEEIDKFTNTSEKYWEEWIEDANKMGHNGEQMMNDFKDILKAHEIKLPF